MAPRRREVVWAQRARQAVDDALGYIADRSPQSARQLATRILEQADSLVTFSERGRIVPEVADPTLRELLIDPFRLCTRYRKARSGLLVFSTSDRSSSPGDKRSRPNQRMELSWRGSRLKGNRSILMAAAAHAAYARFVRWRRRTVSH
jgi:toxin ParE1/3/4